MSDLVERLRFVGDCLSIRHPKESETVHAAADRIEALQAAQAWRPIESAPKDGRWILVPYPVYDSIHSTTPDSYQILMVRWQRVGWSSYAAWMLHEDPTHWMPLPKPPGGEHD